MIPSVAWAYPHDNGGVFLAQARDQERAAAIFDVLEGEPVDYDRIERCEAMDGLGYSRLHGVYTNLWRVTLCDQFVSCGGWIMTSGMDGNGRLINMDTLGDAVVIGDTLYCSDFCAQYHAGER